MLTAPKMAMSEYGAGASVYFHSEKPVRMDHTEEYQCLMHEYYWGELKKHPEVWGKFIWCMFDFAADQRKIGCVGFAGQRSETQTSAGGLFDIRQRQVIDIHDARRLLHTIFHQIDKIGTAGQEFGAARSRDRFKSRLGLFSAAIFDPHLH